MDIQTVSKAILVNEQGQILLLKRSESAVRRPSQWDIPGGHVDEGEYMAEAAGRETFEETGITIDSQEIKLVYGFTEMASEHSSVTWLFFMAKTAHTDVELSNEHTDYEWVNPEEAISRIEYDRQERALKYVYENGLLKYAP